MKFVNVVKGCPIHLLPFPPLIHPRDSPFAIGGSPSSHCRWSGSKRLPVYEPLSSTNGTSAWWCGFRPSTKGGSRRGYWGSWVVQVGNLVTVVHNLSINKHRCWRRDRGRVALWLNAAESGNKKVWQWGSLVAGQLVWLWCSFEVEVKVGQRARSWGLCAICSSDHVGCQWDWKEDSGVTPQPGPWPAHRGQVP